MKLSVVIAAYDERENVVPLTRRLHATLAAIPSCQSEIVYVVDGTDGTREALEALADEVPGLRVFHREKPSGLGVAFRRGFAEVSEDADYVVTMDADLNHQPEEIPRLLEAAVRRDLDILIGSRFVRGGRIEGTPAWKRTLSGTMNVVMRWLWGLPVRDKTSGFRVYKAEALRRLKHRLDDFAFLPEVLILAHRLGMSLGEEPIRFVYRIHGTSKMAISKTIRSYAALLKSRFDIWTTLSAAALLGGVGLRLASTLPLPRWPTEPDALLTAMRALRILRGDAVVFYSGVRLGALESYLHAAVFAVAGVSRGATAVAPLLCGAALLAAFLALSRRLLDRPASTLAFVAFALPAPGFLFWTYLPNGYPLVMLLVTVILFLGDRLARGPATRWTPLALGLAGGLGIWASLQTLSALLPALAWIVFHRGRAFLWPREVGLLAVGLLAGAAPWLAFNVKYPLETFHENFAARPVRDVRVFVENNSYLARYTLPELVSTLDPQGGVNSPTRATRLLRPLALGVFGLGLLAAGALLARWIVERRRGGKQPVPPWVLLLAVAGTIWLIAASSEAVSYRGLNARDLLPTYLAACAFVGLLVTVASGRLRPVVFGLSATILVLASINGAPLPGSEPRARQKIAGETEEAAIRFLEREGVEAVWGDYWEVYAINFLRAGRMTGVPTLEVLDYYGYEKALPPTPVRWALLCRTPGRAELWASLAGIRGTVASPADGVWVFLPSPADPATTKPERALSGALREAYAAVLAPR
jgi:dolichol-phosphate mannosyltransferase